MEEINIWELGSKINVRIDGELYSTIKSMIKSRYGSLERFYQKFRKQHVVPYSVLKDRLKPNYAYFVDLEIYMAICKILKIPMEEMQKHIVAYKTRRGVNYIESPVLPIRINPIFDMLVAHHIGDGCLINCQGNRKNYFAYKQYDSVYRMAYVQKIESLFGKIKYRKNYVSSTTQIYAPIVVSELMYKLYGLNERSFISETARIPKQIFEKNWKNKLAFLIGTVIDEGHVDSCLIVIRLKNAGLIKELSRLCTDLNYKYSIKTEANNYACLYILSSSLSKFYKDYLVLKKEYPEVELGYKGLKIKEFIDRINKPRIYVPGNKDVILNMLYKESLTVNELATRLKMTRQGARYLVHRLEEENKIEVKSIAKFGNWKYGLKK